MKRVLQVVMVALALVMGAGTARASVIAEFSWSEDATFGTVDFKLTNLSAGTIDNVFVEFDESVLPNSFIDAQMAPTTLAPSDQSFNLVTSTPGGVNSVNLSFRYTDEQQQLRTVQQTFVASQLVPEDVIGASPTFWSFSQLFYTAQISVPEPASMTLLGLGIAGAAIVRRRRQ